MCKIADEIVMRNHVSRSLLGWWVEMRFVHCLRDEIAIPADKEFTSVNVPATHHRCPRNAAGSWKYDTVDKTIECRQMSHAKLSNIARVETRITTDDNPCSVKRTDPSTFNRYPDVTFVLLQLFRGIANTEENPRTRNQEMNFLRIPFVKHFCPCRILRLLHRSLHRLQSIHHYPLRRLLFPHVGKKDERRDWIFRRFGDQVKIFALFLEKDFVWYAQGRQQCNQFGIEFSKRVRFRIS